MQTEKLPTANDQTKIKLYFQTLRYLKWQQILARILLRFNNKTPVLRPAPGLRTRANTWIPGTAKKQTMSSPSCFTFLNKSHELKTALYWDNNNHEKLWLYNLHYFDDLNAKDFQKRKQWHINLIYDWINANPPGKGNGWEPYPLSLRIVNWIKWGLQGQDLDTIILNSLAIQIRFLRKNLESHILGNHLFANAKALIFAGLFFTSKEAETWLKKGIVILNHELQEQILGDGGHFERSPMYHAIILEDVLDLINLARTYNHNIHLNLTETANKMLFWLQEMCHPDGEISLFNDAVFEIAPRFSELSNYAKQLHLPLEYSTNNNSNYFPDSGYAHLKRNDTHLLLDVAPLGPDYLPGHGHADTFTFELSLGKQRIIVDSGTSCYNNNAERLRQRGTSAHNTLIIDNRNSSNVWSSFRVAKRAKVKEVTYHENDKIVKMAACHNGYIDLPGKPLHKRSWELDSSNLTIVDEISGKGEHEIVLFFHFHPTVNLIPIKFNRFRITNKHDKNLFELVLEEILSYQVVDSTYHPEFGLSLANKKIIAKILTRIPISLTTRLILTSKN